MIGYAENPHGFWLTHGMARAAGVNLPRAVVEGWLTRRELGSIVARCATCGQDAACTAWLSQAPARPPLALAPACPNRGAIEALDPGI